MVPPRICQSGIVATSEPNLPGSIEEIAVEYWREPISLPIRTAQLRTCMATLA